MEIVTAVVAGVVLYYAIPFIIVALALIIEKLMK